jgi:hypothetical protein
MRIFSTVPEGFVERWERGIHLSLDVFPQKKKICCS